MRSRFTTLAKVLIGWPLSLLALFFVGKLLLRDTGSIDLHAYTIQPLLLTYGLLCFVAYFLLRGYIWQVILAIQGHRVPIKESMYLWAIAEIRRYIPGSVFAFLSRTVLFKRHDVPTKVVVTSLFLEAWYILLSAMLASLFALPYITSSLFPELQGLSSYSNLAIIVVFLSAILFIFNKQILTHKYVPRVLSGMLPSFKASTNAYLLFLHTVAFLLFGIGCYFVASAITYLSPEYFVSLSAFFVLALLVGYASILTPMGLGVREAVIVMGLTPLAPVQTAAFIALAMRLFLIIGELLFLLLVSLWRHMKTPFVRKLEVWSGLHIHILILSTCVLIFSLYFGSVTLARHDNFYTGRFDLGNMDQTVWNTMHGRIFQMTDAHGTEVMSRLGVHADFILVLLAPFYLIWEDPRMLLLIQVVIVAGGAYLVYLIGQKLLQDKNSSLLFGCLYLLYPALQFTLLYDFHAVVLSTTFLLAAYYFVLSKRYGFFLVFAMLAAITKEQVWVIIALFGAWIALSDRTKRIFGISVTIVCVSIFYLLMWHAIPGARGGSNHFALAYYAEYGDTPTKIIKGFVLSPDKTLATLFEPDRQGYLRQLFLPLGFLAVFSPFALVFAAPDLAIGLLSSNPQLHQIYYQYSATITPFIFIASIWGMRALRRAYPQIPFQFFAFLLLGTSLLASYEYGPLPGAKSPNLAMLTEPQKNSAYIKQHLALIPKTESVTATNNLGAHLSHRELIFTLPIGMKEATYVALLFPQNAPESLEYELRKMVGILQNDVSYQQLAGDDTFFLFKKIDK